MSNTNLKVITDAYQTLGVVDETQSPGPEQGVTGLSVLNDMLATMAVDGIRTGWYAQTDLAAIAPLKDADLEDVKYLLSARLAAKTGIQLSDDLKILITMSEGRLAKRYVQYFESDLTNLPMSQAVGLRSSGRY